MQLKTIRKKISSDLQNVQAVITSNLFSNISFINSNCNFFENKSAGKLLRPMLLILLARALGYTGQQHIWFAAIIELIHLATLIHDDVIDEATLRRGTQTFNVHFSNTKAILFGDFIYSKAFQMMTLSNNLKIFKTLANATNKIAEGELFQLQNVKNVYITPKEYMYIIEQKTAILFEAAASIVLELVKNTTQAQQQGVQVYGKFIGLIYQLIDDVCDYTKPTKLTGKFQRKDLFEGKVTLPLILAFSTNIKYKKKAEIIFNSKNNKKLSLLYEFVFNSNSHILVKKLIKNLLIEAQKSICILPPSVYRTTLIKLPQLLVDGMIGMDES